MRAYIICLFINLFVGHLAKSQQLTPTSYPAAHSKLYTFNPDFASPVAAANRDTLLNPAYTQPVKTIPQAFYTSSIGFFCKKELQVQKVVGFPLKFRLGSVAYTDKMEGKGAGNLQPGKPN